MAAGGHPDLHAALDLQHLPASLTSGLGTTWLATCGQVYPAPSEQAAKERLAEFDHVWGDK